MHMLFDDQVNAFSSVLTDLKSGRHVQVFIPTTEPAQDFSSCYDRFRRLDDAADYLFEMLGSGAENITSEPVMRAVSLLSDTLIESRYRFVQERDSMGEAQVREYEVWMESFSKMVADLKAMAPSEVLKQMYCHHLVVGDDVQCFYRFEGFEGDVMMTNMPMNFLDSVISRLVILPSRQSSLGTSLH